MSNQIQLEWSVSVAGTPVSAAAAAAALGAVVLYQDATTDPVLGQFGLTVASDVTAPVAGGATRTLTLNMTSVPGAPYAPPPFPCHPDAPSTPTLPYKLTRTSPLPGDFTVNTGSPAVSTSDGQGPSLTIGDTVQFSSQLGTNYTVATVVPLTLTTPFTGDFAITKAFKVLPAASKLPALYSTSPLDDAAGSGARTVSVSYVDSLGAAGTVVTTLSGKRPAPLVLAGGTVDVAVIADVHVTSTGAFGNSVGQITLSDLSAPIVADDSNDRAQMKIARGLAYLPPSYFALAQQGSSNPQLAGSFLVKPDSADVLTTVDQTTALAAGNTMEFVTQPGTIYTIALVTPKSLTLTTKYSALTEATAAATRITPTPAVQPTADQLKTLLAQFVNPGNATSSGAMTPAPTYLSGFFTQVISNALVVPVTSSAVAVL
jgi:hypothetical protein